MLPGVFSSVIQDALVIRWALNLPACNSKSQFPCEISETQADTLIDAMPLSGFQGWECVGFPVNAATNIRQIQ